MNPAHWRKQPEPVFSKDEGKEVYGPGHNGFADGAGQPWLIYHAAKLGGQAGTARYTCSPFTGTSKACLCLAPPWGPDAHGQPALMEILMGLQRHGGRRAPCTRRP